MARARLSHLLEARIGQLAQHLALKACATARLQILLQDETAALCVPRTQELLIGP